MEDNRKVDLPLQSSTSEDDCDDIEHNNDDKKIVDETNVNDNIESNDSNQDQENNTNLSNAKPAGTSNPTTNVVTKQKV